MSPLCPHQREHGLLYSAHRTAVSGQPDKKSSPGLCISVVMHFDDTTPLGLVTQTVWRVVFLDLAHLVCPSVTFFFLLSLFFFWPSCTACAFRIFSSLTKYGTRVHSNERAKSQPLDRQGTPSLTFIIRVLRVRTFHGEITCHDAFDRTGLYEFKGIISCSSLG